MKCIESICPHTKQFVVASDLMGNSVWTTLVPTLISGEDDLPLTIWVLSNEKIRSMSATGTYAYYREGGSKELVAHVPTDYITQFIVTEMRTMILSNVSRSS